MGSGKSTVGFWLAQSEGLRFVDLDAAIEERQGRSVPEIFEAEGEDCFRDHGAVGAGCLPGRPAAHGGGLRRGERCCGLRTVELGDRAWVCWLRATIDTLGQRVRAGENRPLLGDDPMADLAAIGAARSGLYTETAHEIIDVDGMEAQQVAEQIRRVWPRPVSAR